MSFGLHIRGTEQALCLAKTHGRSKLWTNHTGPNQMGWKNSEACGSEECNSCRKAHAEKRCLSQAREPREKKAK